MKKLAGNGHDLHVTVGECVGVSVPVCEVRLDAFSFINPSIYACTLFLETIKNEKC